MICQKNLFQHLIFFFNRISGKRFEDLAKSAEEFFEGHYTKEAFYVSRPQGATGVFPGFYCKERQREKLLVRLNIQRKRHAGGN